MIKFKHAAYLIMPILIIVGVVSARSYNRNQELKRQRIKKSLGVVTVDLISVENFAFRERIPFTGTLLAVNRAELKAETLGRVVNVNVHEGDLVFAGQILSSQADDDLNFSLKVAESNLKIAKIQSQQAKIDSDRAKALLESGSVTLQDAQKSEVAYDVSIASVVSAENQVNLAKNILRKSHIIAPFTGEIAQRFIQPGEIIYPGQTTFIMVDNRNFEIQADLPAEALTKLKPGMNVLFKVLNFDRTFKAKLTQISSAILHEGRVLRVNMEVIDNDGCLKSGLFVEGEIISKIERIIPALPAEVLTVVGRSADLFVSENNFARYRNILVGEEYNGWRPVYGIPLGTKVVSKGKNLIREGTPLQVGVNSTFSSEN